MEVVVDIQGFKKTLNEFVLKELAISALQRDENEEQLHQVLTFNSPFAWKDLPHKDRETNNWLTDTYHGISWDKAGDIKVEDINDTLTHLFNGVDRIYVKGFEKKKWLEVLINHKTPVTNMEDFGHMNLSDLQGEMCSYHHDLNAKRSKKLCCAMDNVVKIKAWYVKFNEGCFEKTLLKMEGLDWDKITKKDIAFVPKIFWLEYSSHSIDAVWDKLPEHLKNDPEIIGYRRCSEHWNTPWCRTHIDGPPPHTKYCHMCQYLQ